MSSFYEERILSVRHWTDALCSFTATRDPSFRFISGQFTMLGMNVAGRPLLRAYSMASANHEEELEFFSIKVADGPLTSKLQKIRQVPTCLEVTRRFESFSASCPTSGKRREAVLILSMRALSYGD